MSSTSFHISPLYNVLLIRYGEIALKSQQVKKRLLRNLLRNIKFQCTRDKVKFSRIWRDHGFVYLHPEPDHMKRAIQTLQKVLGVHSISPAIFAQGDLAEIQQTALDLARDVLKEGNTFGVRARRIGQHSFSSNEIAKSTGSQILEDLGESLKLSVNLSKPDAWIHINVRDKNIFVYAESIQAPWQGNPIESFTAGGVLHINGHVSEFVSAMLAMRRGTFILPLLITEDQSKDEMIHDILSRFKEFLPIRSFYYFKLNVCKFYSKISNIAEKHNYPPLEYLMKRKLQILLGTWIVNYHKPLFELLESQQRIDWNSNIASYLSNKQQKSKRMGPRRKFVDYITLIEGNHPFSYYSPKLPLMQHIESSSIPILRAAIGFDSKKIKEKFCNIYANFTDYAENLTDPPEMSMSSNQTKNMYPFNPFDRDTVPDTILENFEAFWNSIEQELEALLKDIGLLGDPTLRSTEILELVQI